MDRKTSDNATQEQAKTLGRRDLLKALAATGGAVTVATLLPGKWTKPVIEAGVMPVHAATSGDLRIIPTSLNVFFARQARSNDVDDQGSFGEKYTATFDYVDEACQVDGDTLLYAATDLDGTLINGDTLSNVGATGYADPCKDSISFNFASAAYLNNLATLTVKINAGGRNSNEDTTRFPSISG